MDTKLQLSTGLITFGRRLLKFRLFEMENFLNVNLLYALCSNLWLSGACWQVRQGKRCFRCPSVLARSRVFEGAP